MADYDFISGMVEISSAETSASKIWIIKGALDAPKSKVRWTEEQSQPSTVMNIKKVFFVIF